MISSCLSQGPRLWGTTAQGPDVCGASLLHAGRGQVLCAPGAEASHGPLQNSSRLVPGCLVSLISLPGTRIPQAKAQRQMLLRYFKQSHPRQLLEEQNTSALPGEGAHPPPSRQCFSSAAGLYPCLPDHWQGLRSLIWEQSTELAVGVPPPSSAPASAGPLQPKRVGHIPREPPGLVLGWLGHLPPATCLTVHTIGGIAGGWEAPWGH